MEHKNFYKASKCLQKPTKTTNIQSPTTLVSIHLEKMGERKSKNSFSKLGFRERYLGESVKITSKLPINHAN